MLSDRVPSGSVRLCEPVCGAGWIDSAFRAVGPRKDGVGLLLERKEREEGILAELRLGAQQLQAQRFAARQRSGGLLLRRARGQNECCPDDAKEMTVRHSHREFIPKRRGMIDYEAMNDRERHLATLLFQKPDRVPFSPGGGRKSTLEAWHRQGLPPDVRDYHAHVRKLIGIEPKVAHDWCDIGVDFRMIPQFQEKIIERHPAPAGSSAPGSLVVQDWKGNICEISDEYDVTYLRNPIDFVTRRWIKCPVESRAEWEAMKSRYGVDDPKRFAGDILDRARRLSDRQFYSTVSFSGPFWQLREWLGFENLCMLLLDDPGFAQEMIDFWREFIAAVLDRMFRHYVPDCVLVNEDMAYKEKPMIGPGMARQFLLPCWRHWGRQCKAAGVPIYNVDSDGHVGQLIPVWIEAGFNCNCPQEVAAGNDLPAYRRRFGTKMAYEGGVDKRAMAAGGATLRNEINRLKPVIDAGGYVPSCDHGIPADVSWPNFVEYCRMLAEATGWG